MGLPASRSVERPVREVPLPNGEVVRRHLDWAARRRLDELPDGTWLRYDYDADGHPAAVVHSDGARVAYGVDGSCWSTATDVVTTEITLDEMGLPASVEQRFGSAALRVEYRRDADGRVVGWRYPGSPGWLELVPDGRRAVALRIGGLTYGRAEAQGATTTVHFANGATTVERLDAGHVACVEARAPSGTQRATTVSRDETGTLTHVDGRRASHDEAGRLTSLGSHRWAYDATGRMVSTPAGSISYGDGPQATSTSARTRRAGTVGYDLDRLGRRVASHSARGTTTYGYDPFGQLESVTGPTETVAYAHDGFGRLVQRDDGDRRTLHLVGVDGHRLVDADEQGRILASYVWLGEQCIGRVDGPLGGPLAATFHRDPTGRPLAWVDGGGTLHDETAGDAFGAGAVVALDRPALGGLFADPATDLVHAGTRWLDPAVAQFLTPDSWYGEDAAQQVPRSLRTLLDAVPGGTDCELTPVGAYAWCGYAPLDFTDPSGHNWLGLIFSTISSLLWGMQATSMSLQMELIDFIIDLLQVIVLRPAWDTDGYWEHSVYNIPAPTASYRLMVPWALWFNGVMRGPRAFTLGNVIWYSGTQLSDFEERSERDRVVADVIASFVTATEAAAVDVLRPRNPGVLLTGTASTATPTKITGLAPSTPAGMPSGSLLSASRRGDAVAVRVVGTTTDELRLVSAVGASLDLDRALPDTFGGQTVEVRRLDPGIVRLTVGADSLARTIAIVRGSSAHVARQVPAGYFGSGDVQVEEFLPAAERKRADATVVAEQLLVDLGGDLAPFAVGDVARILSGGSYFARTVTSTQAPASLVLDAPLPAGVHLDMQVARLLPSGETAANQAAVGARLSVTGLVDLAAREGVAVATGGAIERRVVTALVLDCPVDAVDASLRGVHPTPVAVVAPDPATQASGSATAAQVVTTDAGQAERFQPGQPVEVRAAAAVARSFVTGVDRDTDQLTLADPHGLPDGTAGVTVTLLATSPADTFTTAEAIVGAGDHVLVTVSAFDVIAAGQVLHIGGGADRALREVTAAPSPLADLDSPLPASHAGGVEVERLTVDASSVREGASAPLTRVRAAFSSGHAFVVGDVVHIADFSGPPDPGEEIIGTVAEVRGRDIVLQEATKAALAASVVVQAVTATGHAGAGSLAQSLVLIPSDPGEEPYTRRDALQNHEMRHVWQYAMWGPFFLSLPIPWLVHVGFSFTPLAQSEQQLVRHISVGGLDSLFALLAWGIGGAEGSTKVSARVGASRTELVLQAAAAVEKVRDGYRIEVVKAGGSSEYAVVDAVVPDTRTLRLRWELPEGRFADGDTVSVEISPFEQVRKTVSTWFSMNFENIWHDHIPSTWGRALSAVANRDSWFPGLGIYVISVMAAGGDQSRTPFEQDAAYHSGDLYTSITTSNPSTIYAGQFTRAFAFVDTRKSDGAGGSDAAGVADPLTRSNATEQLTVAAVSGGATTDAIIGTQPATSASGEVKFRESWYLPLRDEVGNAMGALLAASQPGTYRLHAGGELGPDGMVMAGFASVGDLESRTITVLPVTLTPDPAAHLVETEQVGFVVTDGDRTAAYGLRAPAGGAALGAVDGLRYTARVLGGGATATDTLELTATYDADHPVFRGPGQLDRDNLAPEQRTNLCQTLILTIDELTVDAPGPLVAGTTVDMTTPIEPFDIVVAPPTDPTKVTGSLRVMNLGGRPARLQVLAPAAVTEPVDFTVTLRFGADPDPEASRHKDVEITIGVTPTP